MTTRTDSKRRDFLTLLAGATTLACTKSERTTQSRPDLGKTRLTSATSATRRLGRTNQMVSILGLGGAHLGRTSDEGEAIRIVRSAIDHGITFMDNCWDYNDGASETRMGKALADGYRQRAFLMTKLDGRTKDAANAQLEQSLRRLRTDAIDLVQVHEVIRMTDPGRVFGPLGAMQALVDARTAGKIRFIGFTGHKDPSIHLAMLKMAASHGFTFDTVQMPVNVMDPHYRSFIKEVLPWLTAHDIGVIGMKSMGDKHILESGAVTATECLRFALSQPTSVVVTGCERMPILHQAIEIASHFDPMSQEEMAAVLARTAPLAKAGKFERFKTSTEFDGTAKNPGWLESANL